jgi:hypothetical protein
MKEYVIIVGGQFTLPGTVEFGLLISLKGSKRRKVKEVT